MPSLTFVLPHWLYWSGLILFPLAAMYLVRRAAAAPPRAGPSLALAYLFLVTAGFIGIHRFYLRHWAGCLYLPLFAGILFCNSQFRALRDAVSKARHDLAGAEFLVERATKALADGVDGAAARLAAARDALAAARDQVVALGDTLSQWDTASFVLMVVIALALAVDALRLPRLCRAAAAPAMPAAPIPEPVPEPVPAGTREDPTRALDLPLTRWIDRLSTATGHFVAYWSVIAVFVYYYEVLARYVFNSPTNWAHESMFLMFGMQYLLAGGFAYREDAHVRVDVFYSMLGTRARAMVDIATSVFFFIFTVALLWTGFYFALDSVSVLEVSFTEWAIQYWPVKAAMVAGAVLLLLQGLAKLVKDIAILRGAGG